MSMHAYPHAFFPSRAIMLVDFSRNRGAFGSVVFVCFCAYFQHILKDQIMLFYSLRAHKII